MKISALAEEPTNQQMIKESQLTEFNIAAALNIPNIGQLHE